MHADASPCVLFPALLMTVLSIQSVGSQRSLGRGLTGDELPRLTDLGYWHTINDDGVTESHQYRPLSIKIHEPTPFQVSVRRVLYCLCHRRAADHADYNYAEVRGLRNRPLPPNPGTGARRSSPVAPDHSTMRCARAHIKSVSVRRQVYISGDAPLIQRLVEMVPSNEYVLPHFRPLFIFFPVVAVGTVGPSIRELTPRSVG